MILSIPARDREVILQHFFGSQARAFMCSTTKDGETHRHPVMQRTNLFNHRLEKQHEHAGVGVTCEVTRGKGD
jgi:hypothetical protein